MAFPERPADARTHRLPGSSDSGSAFGMTETTGHVDERELIPAPLCCQDREGGDVFPGLAGG